MPDRTRRPRPALSPYSTAPFAHNAIVVGEFRSRPQGRVHAKVMGTTLTACGASSLTWFKFYDLLFETAGSQRCEKCQSALAAGIPSHWMPSWPLMPPESRRVSEPGSRARSNGLRIRIVEVDDGWAWSFHAVNHRIIARAPEVYEDTNAAELSANAFQTGAESATTRLRRNADGRYRWQLRSDLGLLAVSGTATYVTPAPTYAAADRVRHTASHAVVEISQLAEVGQSTPGDLKCNS